MEKYELLKDLISKSNKILFFTGAGISTNSGIPDYRGPKGIWKIREPVYFQEFITSDEKKIEYWQYKLENYNLFKNAKPNKAHKALVEFERKKKLLAIVTQNIDDLHSISGNSSEKIIELHGTNSKAECLKCNKIIPIDLPIEFFRKTGKPPKCECGGYLKPAVVMFGQSLPQRELSLAFEMARNCDLCISIGSTLQVQPAALVPYEAYKLSKPYVIINKGETAHDKIATIKIEDDVEKILSDLVSCL